LNAYLSVREDGTFELCVSPYGLNVVGPRLEKGRVLPAAVRELAQNPKDPVLAIRALKAAQGFLAGTEQGVNPPQFGDELPKAPRKKPVK
jgi:hypothetical protein